jgi:UTP-glucose-1-phosphate uridylyltransferase
VHKPSLLILAAGLGSRYKGYKQVESVGPLGACLYDYAVYDAKQAGFDQIVFVINRSMEALFKNEIQRKYGPQARFDYVYQELHQLPAQFSLPRQRTKPWGTSHAVLAAREALRTPFVAINADDYYGPSSYLMIAEQLRNMADDSLEQAMVGFELEKTLSPYGEVSRGACEIRNGFLTAITEREHIRLANDKVLYQDPSGHTKEFKPDTFVSMNFWGFAPQVLFPILERNFKDFLASHLNDPKAEFYLPAAVNNAIRAKALRVKVLKSKETWLGMTYADDLEQVRKQIRTKIDSGIYPENIF